MIFDEQDAQPLRLLVMLEGTCRLRPIPFFEVGRDWNPYDESASLVLPCADGLQRPAMCVPDAAADGQPTAKPGRLWNRRAPRLLAVIVDRADQVLVHAHARVVDRDLNRP